MRAGRPGDDVYDGPFVAVLPPSDRVFAKLARLPEQHAPLRAYATVCWPKGAFVRNGHWTMSM